MNKHLRIDKPTTIVPEQEVKGAYNIAVAVKGAYNIAVARGAFFFFFAVMVIISSRHLSPDSDD